MSADTDPVWVCPDCPDWACGATTQAAVDEGKRLHLRTVHDGVSFADALREWEPTPPTCGDADYRRCPECQAHRSEPHLQTCSLRPLRPDERDTFDD